jgi:hypothetical protein
MAAGSAAFGDLIFLLIRQVLEVSVSLDSDYFSEVKSDPVTKR